MAYAASQTTVLHMKRLNKTGSPIFVVFVCVLCFQRQSVLTFILPEAVILPEGLPEGNINCQG